LLGRLRVMWRLGRPKVGMVSGAIITVCWPYAGGLESKGAHVMRFTSTSMMTARRRVCTAAVTATALALMGPAAASLPAQAAPRQAAPRSCGVSAVVHLHGKVFRVHMRGRFGITPQRGHRVRVNQPAG